jgi:hypothetical protein
VEDIVCKSEHKHAEGQQHLGSAIGIAGQGFRAEKTLENVLSQG